MKTAAAARDHDRLDPLRRQRGRVPVGWFWLLLVLVLAAGGGWWWKGRDGGGAAAGAASAPAGGTASGAFGGPGGPGGPPGGASGGPGGGPGGPGNRRFGAANRVQPVSVQKVRERDIRVSISAIGSIAAANTAVVRPQVSGVLQSIAFTEGQQVRAGQTLATIDPRAFQAALGQVEGSLARDRAQLENARIDLTRYRDLLAKDAIPRQQLDTQTALVRQLEGTVKADEASVTSARLQVAYAKVVAPISGRVGLKQADLGNVVSPGDANGLVTITQTRPISLLFAVPASNLPQITARLRAREPLPVEALDRGGSRRLAVGRLATVDNAIDASTDTIKLKAVFANEDDALFPNQSVSVRLQVDTVAGALAVPQAAVLRGAQGFYVYVVNADSTVSTKVVKPGAVDGDWQAVEGPLNAGDTVVIDGVDRLRDGAKVEVIAADPSQRAGASAPAGGGRRRGGPRGVDGGASGAAISASGARGAASAAGDRPPWLDRLPPDVAERVMKMTPDERREWLQKRREERARQGGGGAG